jgi:hypothetical protein
MAPPTPGQQLKQARRLLKVSQRRAAAVIERPFRSLGCAEAGDPSRAEVARLLHALYAANGVEFGADGRVSLVPGARPGLNVAPAPRATLTGDVGGRAYRVEVEGGEILGIWMWVEETFGRRKGTGYWAPVYGPERPRRAGRNLRPVIEEAEAALARAAA